MKNFNAFEWVILMLTFSVSIVIVISVLGIVFKGSTAPNPGAVEIRSALIDLLKVIVGGIFGAIATIRSTNDKSANDKNKEL